jgi:hypothetical protein
MEHTGTHPPATDSPAAVSKNSVTQVHPSETHPPVPTDHRALLASTSPISSPSAANKPSSPQQHSPAPARSASTSSASALNPRSCVTCRRRKVRCNKENPCANCVRAGIECIFPGPGRAPRKSRKPADKELLERLRRLEGVVTSLGVEVGGDGVVRDRDASRGVLGGPLTGSPTQRKEDLPEDPEDRERRLDEEKRLSVDKHLGRLVISEDRSRYVSNQFWASMGDEIAEMRDLLDAPSSDDDEVYGHEENSPEQSHQNPTVEPGHPKYSSHQGFIFGFSSLKVDLKPLYPPPSQIFILWEVYKENVDPVVKIIHRPTTRNILLNAASSTDKISRPAEALLFSIYYGAVTSLTQEQCRKLLDQDRIDLIRKYRFATEQALARADFLNSSSLMCLQSFVTYLVFLRNMDDSRLVWALGGLSIHLAQALGIHRDGTHFGLPPFETEMRRRLWWHISILDNRSSEDHGTDPTFTEQFYDTKLPLNVNDEDIWPGMVDPPTPRLGATEMTFCLIRFELSVFNRRLNVTAPGVGIGEMRTGSRRPGEEEGGCSLRDQTLQEKEDMIDRCHRRIEDRYLRHCDMNQPILWVSATVARLILAKMWLMVHHPRSYLNDGDAPPPEVKDRLFVTSIEVIEFSYLLEKNENTAKWGWLFRTYMQWQSVAFVLSEICHRAPSGWSNEVERAWRAVESVYNVRFIQPLANHKGMLWRPMRHLWRKAVMARQRHLSSSRGGSNSNPTHAGQKPPVQGDLERGRWTMQQQQTPSSASADEGDASMNNYGDPLTLNDPWGNDWVGGDNVIHNTAAALGLDFASIPDNHSTPESLSSAGGGQPRQQHQPNNPLRAPSNLSFSQAAPAASQAAISGGVRQMGQPQPASGMLAGVASSTTMSPDMELDPDFDLDLDFSSGLQSNFEALSSAMGSNFGQRYAGVTDSNQDMSLTGTAVGRSGNNDGEAEGMQSKADLRNNGDGTGDMSSSSSAAAAQDFMSWTDWTDPGVGDFSVGHNPLALMGMNGMALSGMGLQSMGGMDVGNMGMGAMGMDSAMGRTAANTNGGPGGSGTSGGSGGRTDAGAGNGLWNGQNPRRADVGGEQWY